MKKKEHSILIGAIMIGLTSVAGIGNQIYKSTPAYAQKQQIVKSDGSSFAKSAGIKNGVMKQVVRDINQIIDVDELSGWDNVAPVSDESVLDVRFVDVTDKEGHTYNVAFNGSDGSIYGVVNEAGENIYTSDSANQ